MLIEAWIFKCVIAHGKTGGGGFYTGNIITNYIEYCI
jgi:hypothetical protein